VPQMRWIISVKIKNNISELFGVVYINYAYIYLPPVPISLPCPSMACKRNTAIQVRLTIILNLC